jgi:hypothetical protein
MTHEIKKAKTRNVVRLAASSNGGRTMAHQTSRKCFTLDDSEIEEGLAEYLEKSKKKGD